MATEFGKKLKVLMIQKKNDAHQTEVAKALGYSTGKLSGVLNGTTYPDIPFLIRCQEYFGLSTEETIDLFTAGLSSSKVISLDASYLLYDRKDFLIKMFVTLLFFPKNEDENFSMRSPQRLEDEIKKNIETCYDVFKTAIKKVDLDVLKISEI
jgi:transcriptional regulator with XRE-family HTH domain